MEYKLLFSDEIDHQRWDESMSKDKTSSIFVTSWYLNLTADKWGAVLTPDYTILFPFAIRRKFGINYIYQPFFTRNFGLFGLSKQSNSSTVILNLLTSVFKYWDFAIDLIEPTPVPKLIRTEKIFQVLNLNSSYENLVKNYSPKLRRSIRLVKEEKLNIIPVTDFAYFTNEFKKHTSERIQVFKQNDFDRLQKLLEKCVEKTEVWSYAVEKNNEIIASAFFVRTSNRITYIEGYSSSLGRELRAMHLLFDRLISQYAGQELILDFGGSNVETIAHFFRSFGAIDRSYLHLNYNNLPVLLRWLKK